MADKIDVPNVMTPKFRVSFPTSSAPVSRWTHEGREVQRHDAV